MAPKRKSKRRNVGRSTTKYVVHATFNMRSAPLSKTAADKIAKSARRKGGTVKIKKA